MKWPWRVAAVAWFVGERASQALCFGEGGSVRFIVGQPGWRAAGNIAWQQRMIDVEEQRQQGQHALLAGRQTFECPAKATFIELEKTRAQLAEYLAVDAFVQIGADFMGARHVSSNRLVGSDEEGLGMGGSLAFARRDF